MMNKKNLLVILALGLIVIFGVHLVRSHSAKTVGAGKAAVTEGHAATEVTPVAHAPEVNAAYTKAQELVHTYTQQIQEGKLNNGDTYYQRGLAYLTMQDYRSAIQDFTQAIHIVPDSANAYFNRALAYQQEKMLDNALADLAAAIKYNKDFAAAYNERGLIYVDQGNFNDALTDYNTAVTINPNFDQAYFNLGTLYVREKQYTQAKDAFTKAINSNVPAKDATPDVVENAKKRMVDAYLNLAKVELLMSDLTSALNSANYVISNDPKSVEGYKLRAVIYDKQGNATAATNDNATADNLSIQNMLDKK